MRLFRGTISTNKVGSECTFEVEMDDSITDENEIEEICREEAFGLIEWEYHEVREDKLVSGRREQMIGELNVKYPNVKFGFKEEPHSLQLLHDWYGLDYSESDLDDICDIAVKYLTEEEQNVFAVLYDYYDELKSNSQNPYK